MSHYFVPCILEVASSPVSINAWMEPSDYLNGKSILEHGLVGNNFVEAFEGLLIPNGYYHKSHVVWCSDKAKEEEGCDLNLYSMCVNESHKITPDLQDDLHLYPYIVNHTKLLYIDKRDSCDLHPLPLLTTQCSSLGLEDVIGVGIDSVGSWCRDCISIEKEPPAGYEKFYCCFEP